MRVSYRAAEPVHRHIRAFSNALLRSSSCASFFQIPPRLRSRCLEVANCETVRPTEDPIVRRACIVASLIPTRNNPTRNNSSLPRLELREDCEPARQRARKQPRCSVLQPSQRDPHSLHSLIAVIAWGSQYAQGVGVARMATQAAAQAQTLPAPAVIDPAPAEAEALTSSKERGEDAEAARSDRPLGLAC